MKDRRMFQRISVKILCNIFCETEITATIKDISEEGICIELSEPTSLKVGDKFTFQGIDTYYYFGKEKSVILHGNATVMWISKEDPKQIGCLVQPNTVFSDYVKENKIIRFVKHFRK